jgi:hypothetical protein
VRLACGSFATTFAKAMTMRSQQFRNRFKFYYAEATIKGLLAGSRRGNFIYRVLATPPDLDLSTKNHSANEGDEFARVHYARRYPHFKLDFTNSIGIIDKAIKTMPILHDKCGIFSFFGSSLYLLIESILQNLRGNKEVTQHFYKSLWLEKAHLPRYKCHNYSPLTITVHPISLVRCSSSYCALPFGLLPSS